MRNEVFPLFESLASTLHLEVVRHGLTHGDADWTENTRPGDWNRLYLMLEGEAWVSLASQRVRMETGRAYLLPLGEPYRLEAKGAFRKFFVQFRVSLPGGKDLFAGLPGPKILARPFPGSRALIRRLASTGAEVVTAQAELFTLVARFYEDSGATLDLKKEMFVAGRYRSVFRAAEEQLFRDWDFGALARAENRSLASLSRSFRRDTGTSLSLWFRRRIIRRAQEQLALGDEPVSAVARRLGFDDESYFARLFRKECWTTPREWREMNRPSQGSRMERHH